MIITIAHNKGGVGKTTLALNLATVLQPALIIDQDLHQNLAILNMLRDKPLPVIICEDKKELITQLKMSDQGRLILIDCGGFDSDINRIAIAAADLLIVPANDDINEQIGLRRFDDLLSELSKEMNTSINAHVLLNRCHPNKKNFGEAEQFISHAQHLTRLKSVIPTRKSYPIAARAGLGVTEYSATKYSDAAREIKKLSVEIKAMLLLETECV